MMTLDFPQTIWSQRHADTLNALDHVTFAPLTMFGGLSPTATQAAASNSAATTSSSGSATAAWNAAIDAKVRAGLTHKEAAIAVIKEQPKLQADYIEEFRQQAALR